jgi:4-carboxymuconolactone decarboxylase
MVRIPYATSEQLAEFMDQSGFAENTPPASTLRMLAHAPRVGASVIRLILTLLTETDLDPKLREMVILRVAQRCDGRYVWIQLADIAVQVGVSDAQIAALERGEMPDQIFSNKERTAFAFADEVLDTRRAEDGTFAEVREIFSPGEVLQLLLLIGYFRMISSVHDDASRRARTFVRSQNPGHGSRSSRHQRSSPELEIL